MGEVTRHEFLKYAAAAVAGASLFDFEAVRAVAAKKPLAAPIDLKTLATKAQAEGGSITGYFGSTDLATGFASGFNQAYPWATLNSVVLQTGAILSKVLTEQSAGTGADVFSCVPAQPYLYIRAGAVTPVAIVSDANLGPNQDPTGYRHPYAQNIQALLSNPNLASYTPTDIFDLSKPTYKGQLAMDKPDNLAVSALFLASHRKLWGDKKWMQWLQGLHDNNVFVTASATSAYQAALTGERGIAVDTMGDFLSAPAGAPLKANFYTNAAPYIQSLMLTSYSKKPYTTQLFMNWALSKTGQTFVASTGRSPAMDLPVPTSVSAIVPKNRPIAPYSEIAGFVYNPAPYQKIFDQLWPS